MSDIVLVTGGAGFVGSHLVERLLADGNEVHVFDWLDLDKARNLDEVRGHPRFGYVRGDIRDADGVARFFRPEAKAVFHLASTVGVHLYMKDPIALIDITILGTRNVVNQALKYGTRLIFSSTSEVYGKNPKVPWSEDADRVLGPPTRDRWSYSSSKAVCEHILNAVNRGNGLPTTIVRFFNAYGPRQNSFYVVSQSIYKVLRGEQPLLYDGGAQTRCFTYVSDIGDGLMACLSREAAIGETFNLGNPVETTVGDVIRMVIEEAGSDVKPLPFDTRREYGKVYEDVPRRIPAVDKAKRLLDWSPTTDLRAGIRASLDWARNNSWWLAGA